jgi:hypothetical protein
MIAVNFAAGRIMRSEQPTRCRHCGKEIPAGASFVRRVDVLREARPIDLCKAYCPAPDRLA